MDSGFVVMESCEDYEQILGLETGEEIPAGGILGWASDGATRTVFPDRKLAREAIERTYYYAKAFGYENMPEKKFCKIIKVQILSA